MSDRSKSARLLFTLLADTLAVAGILLAGYLFFLTALPWPCAGGGCSEVLRSEYGKVAIGPIEFPVAMAALVAWVALFFLPLWAGKVLLAMMLVGAGYFIYLQIFTLKAFCLWCNTHHLLVLLLLVVPARPLHRSLATLGLLLLFPLLLWEQVRLAEHLPRSDYRYPAERGSYEERSDPLPKEAETEDPVVQPDQTPLLWDNPEADSRAILVLNLDCPECVVKLDQLAEMLRSGEILPRARTRIYFLSSEEIFRHQALFLAAVFPADTDFAEALANNWPPVSQLLADLPRWRDLPVEELEALLSAEFPELAENLEGWHQRLRRQQEFLNEENLQVTPLLIDEEGWTSSFSASSILARPEE